MTRYAPPPEGVTPVKGAVSMIELFFDSKGQEVDGPETGGTIEWTFYGDEEDTVILHSVHGEVLD
ncbi:MAG: hypothetical protein GY926_01590 [bacterium]|nr:hypothetical protein [bacterium]